MGRDIIIGIDIGTTGVRSVAYQSGQSTAHAIATEEYPLFTDQTGVAEQDANSILLSTVAVIKRTVAQLGDDAKNVRGLAISSVLHSFLALAEEGTPLTRLMTWGDSRSQIYLDEVKSQIDVERLYHRTGCPIHPMYSLLKIYWLKKTHPDTFARSARFGTIKDFVFHHLTGVRVVDRSIASGSGCYNIQTLEWDKEILALLGIGEERMVKVVSTTHYENLTDAAAARLGLPHPVPVVIGAGDGMMANIGVGAIRPGQINITIGTSGAIRMASKEPRTDAKRRTWCYNVTDDRWMLGGAINNGGVSFRWARDKFAETEQRVADKLGLNPYALLTSYAEKVSAGSDGLIVLPFFTGERAPLLECQRARHHARPDAQPRQAPHYPRHAGGHLLPHAQRAGIARGANRQGGRDPRQRQLYPFAGLATNPGRRHRARNPRAGRRRRGRLRRGHYGALRAGRAFEHRQGQRSNRHPENLYAERKPQARLRPALRHLPEDLLESARTI
ncbi:Autoinducer 2 kinase LsrK [Leminorella grimontii]|nr:gluconokinase [Leminorella grimontii]VFS56639.1 Autoinducer 2 kinase LsrK [Leminorella grimontii]